MKILSSILFALIIVSCGSKPQLSSGPFKLESSKHFERVIMNPVLEFDTLDDPGLLKCRLYLNNHSMFDSIANDLGLSYQKYYYYYPNGEFSRALKIGSNVDTLKFHLLVDTLERSTSSELGEFAFGVLADFSNKTYSIDTTLIQFY